MYKKPQQNVSTKHKQNVQKTTTKCINNLNKMYNQLKQNVYKT